MNRTVFSLPATADYTTARGLEVSRRVTSFSGGQKLDTLIDLLDRRRGVVLSSGTTVPGRYESFDLGFGDPPLRLESRDTNFTIAALNPRGKVLVAFLAAALSEPCVVLTEKTPTQITGHIVRGDAPIHEDQRTRRASIMSLVLDVIAALASPNDPMLGLYGAFAYDLVFQIEDLKKKRAREDDLADRLLLRPPAGPRDAGDRDRDIGVAVRQHPCRHCPGGRERDLAEGFQYFATDIELALLRIARIGDEAGAEHVGAARDVGQRRRYHAAGAAFGDGDLAPGGAVGGKGRHGGLFTRGLARFDDRRQGSILRK